MKQSITGKHLAILLITSLLCGCGAPGDKPAADDRGNTPSASGSESPSKPEAVYDLMKEKWARERTDSEAVSWNVASCLEVALPNQADADYSFSYSAVEGSCHYMLTNQVSVQADPVTLQPLQSAQTLYFTRTDVDSGESVMERLELKPASGAPAEENAEGATLTGMDVSAGKIYLFFQQNELENSTIIHYYKVQTDMEGQIEEILDLLPALQAGGIVPEDNMLLSGGRCDSAGLCYLGDVSMSRVCVIDREGNLLTVLEDAGGQGNPLIYIGKLPEGTPLYACSSFQEQRLSVFGYDGRECRELYRGESEYLEQCLIRPNGDLLYGRGSKLFRWNVILGTCESLYEGRELNFANCEGIVCSSDGKPYAAFKQGDGTFLYGFTDEKMETVTIHIEQIAFLENEYLQKCASAYTSRHPGVVIDVAAPEDDRNAQLSRLITRLSQGEGPDLILVRPNELLALYKNDALADLSEILTAEEREQFFPGVLESGQIGDGLYGLACGVSFSTLIVADQVWPETSWTLSDILKILQEREKSGDPFQYFQSPGKYDTSSRDLLALILQNIGRSSLLDLQEGKCHFDSDEFRQTLEFCKKSYETARDTHTDSSEPEERLREGKTLVCEVSGDLKHFSNTLAMLGEGYHAVGYPTAEGESGHLMLTTYEDYVAVNAQAEHREIIDDFLRYLVSYQAQQQYSMSWIRMDVLKDCVKEGVTTYGYPTPVPLFSQGSSVIILGGKPDGSSYLPEFLEMAKNSHPNDSELDTIRNMIQEEADAYFTGDKSLDETVELIQNRVQLFLDESR